MENDHQYEFPCTDCGTKLPFKNQLKIHRREVHEEGLFSCFVCNYKFKTHKELKQHIQRKCKPKNGSLEKTIIHKRNEDILEEDEHKCPICPKITNNQISLINHMNTKHNVPKDKCDSCGQEFDNKETLIKHIVEHHTVKGTQVIPRHICSICNVELHGDEAKNNHICRKPQSTCSFCKKTFYSQEARNNHVCEKHLFKSVADQLRAQKRKNTECKNGAECYRASFGKCWFKHSQPIRVSPHRGQRQYHTEQGWRQGHQQQGHGEQQGEGEWQEQGQQGRQGQQGYSNFQRQQEQRKGQDSNANKVLYCRYQERCHSPQSCRFKHVDQGFLEIAQNTNQQ